MSQDKVREILVRYRKKIHGTEYDFHAKLCSLEQHQDYLVRAEDDALSQLNALNKIDEGKCPRCKELLTFPRGDTPYCEECGYPEEDFGKPEIICLCGSSRFVAQMACIAWALERDEGAIVLGLHLLPQDYPNIKPDHMAEHEGKKDHMDELHKRKIDLANKILIVNIGGYIGESTRSEIEYAKKRGKPVKYLEKL